MSEANRTDSISQGRSRSAADRLLSVSTPDVYRRNPFRVLGLPTDAPSRLVRQRRQLAQAHRFDPSSIPGDTRLPLAGSPDPDQVRAAFDALDNPEHRLVDELLWWWGEPGACGCAAEVHELHDQAVNAHASVLDAEQSMDTPARRRSEQWREAARCWFEVLDDGRLWDHVRHRVQTLRDRRIDESTVEGLREALPRALLRPQVNLATTADEPARLVGLLDSWDFHPSLLDEERTLAVRPMCDRVLALTEELERLRNAGEYGTAARRAVEELLPAAHRLDVLSEDTRLRQVRLARNRAATSANNTAIDLWDNAESFGPWYVDTLLEEALELAVEPDSRTNIENNLRLRRDSKPKPPPMSAQMTRVRDRVQALIDEERWVEAARVLAPLRTLNTLTSAEREWVQMTLASIPEQHVAEAQRAKAADDAGFQVAIALFLAYTATLTLVLPRVGLGALPTGLVVAFTLWIPAAFSSRHFFDGKMRLSLPVGCLGALAGLGYLLAAGFWAGWSAFGFGLAGLLVGGAPAVSIGDALAGRRER